MPRRLSRFLPRPARAAGAAALLVCAAPSAARAQGSLGTQGFGYPTGQLSTRALGTGGGLGEFDPVSPLNPASIAGVGRITLAFQYDPEFRQVRVGSSTTNGTIARFPVIGVTIPVRDRVSLGISASTLLDRTYRTDYRTTSVVGDQTVTADERVESRGSIADVRFAAGVQAARWLRVGAAAHLLTGENRLVSGRTFPDTTRFGSVNDSTTIDYSGTAASLGVELTPVRGVSVAGSYRLGGAMRLQRNDTTLTRGDAPGRMGVALRFDRVTGATFAAAWARTSWTGMRGLAGSRTGREPFDVQDADELMLGVEAVGPRLGDNVLLLRLGGRQRDLPFGLQQTFVRERAYSGGLGLPFVGGRALADVAVQHARRTPRVGTAIGRAGLAEASERAWTLSIGFTVRP